MVVSESIISRVHDERECGNYGRIKPLDVTYILNSLRIHTQIISFIQEFHHEIEVSLARISTHLYSNLPHTHEMTRAWCASSGIFLSQ